MAVVKGKGIQWGQIGLHIILMCFSAGGDSAVFDADHRIDHQREDAIG